MKRMLDHTATAKGVAVRDMEAGAARAAQREQSQTEVLLAELGDELAVALTENERLTALVEQLRADNRDLINLIDGLTKVDEPAPAPKPPVIHTKPPWDD